MKKILLILLIFLVGCGNDINKFKKEYEKYDNLINVEIDKTSSIKYLNAKETVEFLNKESGILFFGIANDNKTRSVVETLLDVANENNLTVYYFDPNTVKDKENDKNFAKILGILGIYLQTNDKGEKILEVPDVYFIKDGIVLGSHFGSESNYDGKELTNEQKEKLYENYNSLAKRIGSE